MQVLIIDGDSGSAEALRKQLNEIIETEYEIQRVGSGARALAAVEENVLHPDVIFIDLKAKSSAQGSVAGAAPQSAASSGSTGTECASPDGIRTAGLLLEKFPGAQIVFTSDSDDYYLAAYEVEHAWFLRKPIDPCLLRRAWERALQRMGCWERNCFACEFNRTVYRIPYSEILFFENNSRKITIHTADGKGEYPFYGVMSEVMTSLGPHFIRCHNSYIVNIDKVDTWTRTAFTIAGHKIPISRRYADAARDAFRRVCMPCGSVKGLGEVLEID